MLLKRENIIERQAKSCLPFFRYSYFLKGKIKMKNATTKICALGIVFNAALFFTKLYVGLSSNSISIYSDSVNNLFDCLCAVISLCLLSSVIKSNSFSKKALYARIEYLLSFCLCVVVFLTGAVFLYSSVERLMYPTPIWYTDKYFYILLSTAVCKLSMFFIYKAISKKEKSPINKIMVFDCLLDFFVTSIAVIGLLASKGEFFAIDSVCGITVSIILIISAFKMLSQNLAGLIGCGKKQDRDTLDKILFSNIKENEAPSLYFSECDGKTTVHIKLNADQATKEKIKKEIELQTELAAEFI